MIGEIVAVALGLLLSIAAMGLAFGDHGQMALPAITVAIAGAALLLTGSLFMTARWMVGELRRRPDGSDKG